MAAPTTYGEEKESIHSLKKVGDFVKCYYKAENGKIGKFSLLSDYTNRSELPKLPILNRAHLQTTDLMCYGIPDGFFYLVCIDLDYDNGTIKACPDRPIQAGITWQQIKSEGLIDGTFRTKFGRAQIGSRSELRVLSAKTNIAEDLRSALGFPQSSIGWCGGYKNTTTYYYDTYEVYDDSWTLLELTRDEVDAKNFKAIFDWYGEASQSALLSNYEHGIRGNITIAQSKAVPYSSMKTDNGGMMYSYMALRPIFEIPMLHVLYKNDSNIYGMQHDGTQFVMLSEDWDSLNGIEKKEKFLSTGYNVASIDQLKDIQTFKMFFYSEINVKGSASIIAAPKERLTFPRAFISLETFKNINKVALTSVLTGSSVGRIIATTDLKKYETYDFTAKAWQSIDHTDCEAVKTYGIDAAQLANISCDAWNKLLKGKSGIGFAYLPSIENTSDKCEVDKLEAIVNMKGTWDPRTM